MTEESLLNLESPCGRDSCEMKVRIVIGDSVGEHRLWLQCQHCDQLFLFPWVEEGESEPLFEIVGQARNGNQSAKRALLVVLETERRPVIFRKLSVCDVRPQDLADALHDLEIRVYEKIEQLRITKAYFSWEARIIAEISGKFRGSYQAFGEPLDCVLSDVERALSYKEVRYGHAGRGR